MFKFQSLTFDSKSDIKIYLLNIARKNFYQHEYIYNCSISTILLISGEFVSIFNKVGRNLKDDLVWNKEGDPIISAFNLSRNPNF